MNNITSLNPYDNSVLEEFKPLTANEVSKKVKAADIAFQSWKKVSISKRAKLLKKVGDILLENIETYAKTITLEMGKPISESIAEIEKCAWVCDFYAKNAEEFLADEIIETDASESFISYDPLGTVLAVMPWNYPFWQVFRFAVPTVTAGNTALLKHASNVSRCALHIEEVFQKAGYPENVFQTLIISSKQVKSVIENDLVKAISLTGSEKAGASVASIAGQQIKKSVLELGGNNAFIVLKDADIEWAVKTAIRARFQNTGQSCIAAKRFIIEESVYDQFLELFQEKLDNFRSGNPSDQSTNFGVMAREDLAKELDEQVKQSVNKGAKITYGGTREKAYFPPTILENVKPGMPAFDEELFGPVASFIVAKDEQHAFELANQSTFGLGVSIFTKNIQKIKKAIGQFEDGAVFINELVKSDPRLPFGGTKKSGFGRELSREGILEFVNTKTVYIKKT